MSKTAESTASSAASGSVSESLADQILRVRDENGRLQEYLDRIFGISSAIIYILDANGHFTFVNRGVEEMLNFSTEELIGKHFSFILPPDEYERVSREVVLPRIAGRVTGPEETPKLFNERRSGVRRTRNLEVRMMKRGTGDYRMMIGDVTGIVEVQGAYSLNDEASEGGNVFLGSQGVIFDITRFKKAENERIELYKRLFQVQKLDAIGKLAGRVAHDLNNKLGSIIGTAEMVKHELAAGNTGAPLMLYVDTLLTASKHASELSNKLSEFSRRGDSGFVKVDFHELIDGVMELIRSIADHRVTIRKALHSQNPAIMGSETMLRNAMLNITVNALEAMKPTGGGTLTIETADIAADTAPDFAPKHLLRRGKYLMVSVCDTGIGMDEETKSKLFDPFFTSCPEKGMGLGLVSFRECVRSHGGIIDIHSAPGNGARFDIYFPAIGE